ncbi:MAG: hypothetical protein ACE5KG_00010 [Nitrososphaerales archaeon]
MGSWIALTTVSVIVLLGLGSLMKRTLARSVTPVAGEIINEKIWAFSRIEESKAKLEAREFQASLELSVEAVRDVLNQLMKVFSPGSEDYNIAEMAYILAEAKIVDVGAVDQIYSLNKLKLKSLTSGISEKEALSAIQIAGRFVYRQKLG